MGRKKQDIRSDMIRLFLHDMLSPLAVIRAAIDNTREYGKPNDFQRGELKVQERSVERILRLMDDLRFLCGSNNPGEPTLAEFDLFEVIDESLLDFLPREDGGFGNPNTIYGTSPIPIYYRGQRYRIATEHQPILVCADRTFTRLAFTNLFSNATKYGETRVDFDMQEDSEVLKCSVENDKKGGIAPEYTERIFDQYFRIPGTKKHGWGLGLYLTKRLVESQGGEIGLESDDRKVVFYFTIPRKIGERH